MPGLSSCALNVLENRSQQGRPFKVVQIRRGYAENPDAARDRHYADPEDRDADVVIFEFTMKREGPTEARIVTRRLGTLKTASQDVSDAGRVPHQRGPCYPRAFRDIGPLP